MSEAEFVRKLKAEMNKCMGRKVIRLNTGPHGAAGEPDMVGCWDGQMFALEVKLAYNKPTDLQLKRLHEWAEAGAYTEVVTDDGTPAKEQAQRVMSRMTDWIIRQRKRSEAHNG